MSAFTVNFRSPGLVQQSTGKESQAWKETRFFFLKKKNIPHCCDDVVFVSVEFVTCFDQVT